MCVCLHCLLNLSSNLISVFSSIAVFFACVCIFVRFSSSLISVLSSIAVFFGGFVSPRMAGQSFCVGVIEKRGARHKAS